MNPRRRDDPDEIDRWVRQQRQQPDPDDPVPPSVRALLDPPATPPTMTELVPFARRRRQGDIVGPDFEEALDAYGEGPHTTVLTVVCGHPSHPKGAVVGKVEATSRGLLLSTWWKEKAGVMGEDISLLDGSTEPWSWFCERHGASACSRDDIKATIAAGKKKLTIHRD